MREFIAPMSVCLFDIEFPSSVFFLFIFIFPAIFSSLRKGLEAKEMSFKVPKSYSNSYLTQVNLACPARQR